MSPRPRDWYYRFKCGHPKKESNRAGRERGCRICQHKRIALLDRARKMTKPKPAHLRRTNKHDLTFEEAEQIRALVRRGFAQKRVAAAFRLGQETVRQIVHMQFLATPPAPPEPAKPLLEIIRAEIAVKPVPLPTANGRSYSMFPPKRRSA